MITELLVGVLQPFITKVTEEFLRRRRDAVDMRVLQDQVAQLVAAQYASSVAAAEVRRAVMVLTRYLVVTSGNMFLIEDDGDELRLATRFDRERDDALRPAIRNFDHLLRQEIRRRQLVSAELGSSEKSALDGFTDGFAEEILDLRLGREHE